MGSVASQAFCRLAAVKGAIYVLRRQVSGIGVKPFTPTPQPSSPSPPPESANQPALSQPSPAASNQQSADRFNSSTPAQQDSAPDAAASCAERTCLPGDAALPTPQVSFKANVPAKPRQCTVQTQGGQRLGCDVLVANAAYDGSALRSTALGGGGGSNCLEGGEGGDVRARRVARCVCVTDRSLLQDKSQLLVVRRLAIQFGSRHLTKAKSCVINETCPHAVRAAILWCLHGLEADAPGESVWRHSVMIIAVVSCPFWILACRVVWCVFVCAFA